MFTSCYTDREQLHKENCDEKIPSQTEKKMIYGIRSLKNGTGSVLIGASIVLLSAAMPTISANENLPQTQKNTSAVTKAPTETETSQTQRKRLFLNKRMQTLPLILKRSSSCGNYYSTRNT